MCVYIHVCVCEGYDVPISPDQRREEAWSPSGSSQSSSVHPLCELQQSDREKMKV